MRVNVINILDSISIEGVSEEIYKAVEKLDFDAPTEIQERAIPHLANRKDIIALSQTGTGKTMTFAIPASDMVCKNKQLARKLQVLVICPTRELTLQAAQEFRKLLSFSEGLSVAEVYGGSPIESQIVKLKKTSVAVGTPGRILDHIRRGTIKLENVGLVVLDEADEMLKMGFIEDIESILSSLPESRTTALFSATMPEEIKKLTHKYLHDPVTISVNPEKITVDKIRQSYVTVPMGRKKEAAELLLRSKMPKRCMIFCNTRSMVDEVSLYLSKRGFDALGLHGEIVQSQRTKTMERFKSGKLGLLIATDVAARGIDVKDLDLVINYDIPQSSEHYVHRIGRTGRAGRSGDAVTICSGKRQESAITNIARDVKSQISKVSVPTPQSILEKLRNMRVAELSSAAFEDNSEYTALAEKLISTTGNPEGVLSAVLKLLYADTDRRLSTLKPITDDIEPTYEPNDNFASIVIDVGRSKKIAPNHLVGAITKSSGIRGAEIGKIVIYDDFSLIDVPVNKVMNIVDSMLGTKIGGNPVRCYLAPQESPKKRRTKK